jgi:hypothetical protein
MSGTSNSDLELFETTIKMINRAKINITVYGHYWAVDGETVDMRYLIRRAEYLAERLVNRQEEA